MGTSIQDSHLAESIGYSGGRRRGHNEGWNAAAAQANAVISQQDAEILRLRLELEKANGTIDRLDARVEVLMNQISESQQAGSMLRGQGLELKAENEKLKKLVLGLTAVARPALTAVARLPYAQRRDYVDQYIDEAMALLGIKFESAEKFPHNLGSVVNHVPLSRELFYRTVHEGRALKAQQNNIEEANA